MSEAPNTLPHHRLAAHLEAATVPHWRDFERLATLPEVQRFCTHETRYAENATLDVQLEFLKFAPTQEIFTAARAAEVLERSHTRLEAFLDGIVKVYCVRKRLLPPDMNDDRTVGDILAKVFTSIERVYDYLSTASQQENIPHEFFNQGYEAHMPATLLVLAARLSGSALYDSVGKGIETDASQQEIDDTIDVTLQQACQKIQQGEKHTLPKKGVSNADRVFAGSMNCLRTLYHKGKDKSFKAELSKHFIYLYKPPTEEYRDDTLGYDLDRYQVDWFNPFAEYMNRHLGTDFTLPPLPALHKFLLATEERYDALLADYSTHVTKLDSVLTTIYSVHAARQLVDAIADGSIKYSRVQQAMMMLRQQPLMPPSAPPPPTRNEWVNWEILPPGVYEAIINTSSPEEFIERAPTVHEREIDWLRLWRLREYAKRHKGSYLARTAIENISKEKQYYAVILPRELADGTVQEDAIADHPETGRGLYAWRSEMGFLMAEANGKILTWREVLSRPRLEARALGARCLYHTVNLDANLEDYLTQPPHKLKRSRYAIRSFGVAAQQETTT